MALKTRQPTGAVPWPLILIEGEEKAGKTWACAEFTASDKVGRCFWIDLGEGAADEYGAIPGANYEIVEYDGSFSGLVEAVKEIHALAAQALAAGEKPVVLIIDTMTSEWDLLKDWATDRAKGSKSNRKKLAEDPNAEIVVSPNYWTDANNRHKKLMRLLKAFPGIALMTSHGKSVAVIGADGQPVEGKKEHKVEAQKSLGADASCWLRLYRTQPGVIVGGRSVHLKFRPGDEERKLAADWTLENIIFGVLQCDPAKAHTRNVIDPKADAVTPEQILAEALHPETSFARVKELYAEARRLCYDDVSFPNAAGDGEEPLLEILFKIGQQRSGAPANGQAAPNGRRARPAPAQATPPAEAPAQEPVPGPVAGPAVALAPEDPWAAKVEDLTTAEEARAAEAELDALFTDGQITAERCDEITEAIRARFPAPPPAPLAEAEQAPAPPAPAPATPPPARPANSNGGRAGGQDEAWIRQFNADLKAAGLDQLLMLRRSVGQAVMHKTITTDQSAVLTKQVADRKRELEGASQ
jgi:AAA domain